LCRLVTRCKTFDEVLDLAEMGDASLVDMTVGDIYGGGYDKFHLSPSVIASSFGKLVMKEEAADGIREEDMARSLLMMITSNIGQVAYLNATIHKATHIYFVGNFLRHNKVLAARFPACLLACLTDSCLPCVGRPMALHNTALHGPTPDLVSAAGVRHRLLERRQDGGAVSGA
jgi:hypothetical protein